MANATVKTEKIEFIIKDEATHCNIFVTSNEDGTPWGTGWRTKTFPKTMSCIDILQNHFIDSLTWNNGREGVDNEE
jgi:hypothetical protein